MILFCRCEIFRFVPLFTLLCQSTVAAFVNKVGSARTTTPCSSRCMGLYDTPLPPRTPPRDDKYDDSDDDDDDNEEDDIIQVSSLLFLFNVQGKEVNDLLPPLGRRLDKGIGCYFEPYDKLVQNLVEKTSCSIEDACWALEACKGDLTEAWTRISVARRNQLDTERASSLRDDGTMDLDQLFQKKKQARLQKEQTRERLERMKRSKPDTDWLPIKNPKPIDDEPWFTG